MSGRRKGQSVQLICGGNRCCGMRAQRRRLVSAHYRITDGDRYHSQKYECNNHPCEKINSESIGLHTRVTCVGSGNTRIGNEKRRERQPESAIGRERYSGTIVSHTIELTDGVKGTARHARQRLNVFYRHELTCPWSGAQHDDQVVRAITREVGSPVVEGIM